MMGSITLQEMLPKPTEGVCKYIFFDAEKETTSKKITIMHTLREFTVFVQLHTKLRFFCAHMLETLVTYASDNYFLSSAVLCVYLLFSPTIITFNFLLVPSLRLLRVG